MSARELEYGVPLNPIDFDLRRLFRRWLVKRGDQLISIPNSAPIDFFQRVAAQNRRRIVLFTRDETCAVKRTVSANVVDLHTSADSVLPKRK